MQAAACARTRDAVVHLTELNAVKGLQFRQRMEVAAAKRFSKISAVIGKTSETNNFYFR